MFHINSISSRLLRRNGILTISCILSIMIGTLLILEMFSLSSSAEKIYERDVKAAYGDCDAAVFYGEYGEISPSKIRGVSALPGVEETATLYYSGNVDLDGSTTYAIGTDNSEIVRSRYHFTSELGSGEVAVNQVLAKSRGYQVGTVISAGGRQLTVKEIFDDETLSASSVEMLIADKATLRAISPLVGDTNVILLKIPKLASSHVAAELEKIDPELSVLLFGTDEEYLKSVNSFKVFIRIVAACVLIVTILFTTTVFRNFLYKYRREVAVLRMAGADPEQVKSIFGRMIFVISATGTVLGYVAAALVHYFLIDQLNQKYKLIEGMISFQFGKSLLITVIILIAALIILNASIRRINQILPIEALALGARDAAGKMKKNRRLSSLLRGNDFFISRRLIQSRLKDNRRMIATIAMLVAIGIIGGNVSAAIKRNGEDYYRQYYLTEFVVTVSQATSFEEGLRFSEEFREKSDATVSALFQASFPARAHGEALTYGLADLEGFRELGLINGWNADEVVLSSAYARREGLKIGDVITLSSPAIHAKDENGITLDRVIKEAIDFEFQVGAIAEADVMQGNAVLLDLSENAFVNESTWLTRVYADGDKSSIQNALNILKNRYPAIKWASYADAVSVNEQKVSSRFAVLNLVIRVLILVAAIGWIHSLQNILISRERDYQILRMQGVKRSRICKIMLYQILVYLAAGVLGGMLLGIGVFEGTFYLLQRSFLWWPDLSAVLQVLCILTAFCVILIPTMVGIGRKKLA